MILFLAIPLEAKHIAGDIARSDIAQSDIVRGDIDRHTIACDVIARGDIGRGDIARGDIASPRYQSSNIASDGDIVSYRIKTIMLEAVSLEVPLVKTTLFVFPPKRE